MRFIFRLLALVCLAVAVIAAVVDGARSIAASKLMLTALGKGWADLAPSSLSAAQSLIQGHLPEWFYNPAFLFLLSMPAAAVFALLGAILYAAGARRERPFGGR